MLPFAGTTHRLGATLPVTMHYQTVELNKFIQNHKRNHTHLPVHTWWQSGIHITSDKTYFNLAKLMNSLVQRFAYGHCQHETFLNLQHLGQSLILMKHRVTKISN